MGYTILQFNCGSDFAQGYVLSGNGIHEGTSEPISVDDMRYYSTDAATLARFLDFRFLRAHGERIGREMNLPVED